MALLESEAKAAEGVPVYACAAPRCRQVQYVHSSIHDTLSSPTGAHYAVNQLNATTATLEITSAVTRSLITTTRRLPFAKPSAIPAQTKL